KRITETGSWVASAQTRVVVPDRDADKSRSPPEQGLRPGRRIGGPRAGEGASAKPRKRLLRREATPSESLDGGRRHLSPAVFAADSLEHKPDTHRPCDPSRDTNGLRRAELWLRNSRTLSIVQVHSLFLVAKTSSSEMPIARDSFVRGALRNHSIARMLSDPPGKASAAQNRWANGDRAAVGALRKLQPSNGCRIAACCTSAGSP